MMLINPEGHKIYCAMHFGLKTSNNEVEYEALIEGLHLAHELQVCNVNIFSNSHLIVNQVNHIYIARREKMATYLDKAKKQVSLFSSTSIEDIPRNKNSNADALAKLTSTRDSDLLGAVSMEF